MLLGAIGCGSAKTAQEQPGSGTSEAAKSFDYNQSGSIILLNDLIYNEYYTSYMEPHIKKKFPNVKIEYYRYGEQNVSIESMVADKKVPDIYATATGRYPLYADKGIFANLDPIAKANKLDLSVFEDTMLQSIRNISGKDELFALPYTYGINPLFYNKDIFDRYGVAYPKDGMTWDSKELRDMLVKLNRPQDGVSGIVFQLSQLILSNQLSLPLVDAKTEKAAVQTPGFKTIVDTFAELYRLGGKTSDADFDSSGQKAFMTSQKAAMWAGNAAFANLLDLDKKGQGFNWDVVSLPTFKEAPGMGTQYSGAIWSVSNVNGKQDLAAHIAYWLTSSKEIQIEGGGLLRFPTLKDAEVKASYGKGEKLMENKNVKGLLVNKVPVSVKATLYDGNANSILVAKTMEVLKGTKDSNTALREAGEEIDKKIAELRGAK
ncbi:MAG: family 1 extracellular solute-binding protein [Paenibacillus sp.]|jgi:multiple sugar transport system substrate-binding protein|nr:family 1 extracellular solute-binding protein [Paenibacillus sp.]